MKTKQIYEELNNDHALEKKKKDFNDTGIFNKNDMRLYALGYKTALLDFYERL